VKLRDSSPAEQPSNLLQEMQSDLGRLQRESDFVYFDKVPEDPPALLPGQSLLKVPGYEMPAAHPLCTPALFAAFDLTKKKERPKPVVKDEPHDKGEDKPNKDDDKEKKGECIIL